MELDWQLRALACAATACLLLLRYQLDMCPEADSAVATRSPPTAASRTTTSHAAATIAAALATTTIAATTFSSTALSPSVATTTRA